MPVYTCSRLLMTAEVLLAIHFEANRFGASAYFNSRCFIMDKDCKGIDYDLVAKLSNEGDCLHVITSTKSNIPAIKNALPEQTNVRLIPANEFNFNLERHGEKSVPTMKRTSENESCIMALSGLLYYLNINSVTPFPDSIEVMNVDPSTVSISKHCLRALQIFDGQTHPNMHATGGFKEELSVFSLFNHAITDCGRHKLREWFLNPTNNTIVLKSRLDSIDGLMDNENREFVKLTEKAIKKCINICTILTELRFKPSTTNLLKVSTFCEGFLTLHDLFSECNKSAPIFDTIKSFDPSVFRALHHMILRTIDVNSCNSSDICMVREYISPALDALRSKYHNLPEFLTSVAAEISAQISEQAVDSLNIIYFPQLGFLVTIPLQTEEPNDLASRLKLELQFQSDKICYFKSDKMRELDSRIGDVYADIVDAQLEILQEMVNEVIKNESLLLSAIDACAELDCLMALARTASTHGLVRPEIVNFSDADDTLIEDGRHLLLEQCSGQSAVISNDCQLSSLRRIMILTGANSSGKSVYLKQIGIIVYLAHIGSRVPAKMAKIGLVDRIMTRVRTQENISANESSFMADLKEVRMICDKATSQSLVLIDEFGKGTCHRDGLALFAGVLNHFGRLGTQAPRLIAITHMHELFRWNLLAPELVDHFQLAHMKIHLANQSGLVYLYRIAEGLAGQSFAIECAREAGIPEEIIQKATTFSRALGQGASPQELHLLNEETDLSHYIALLK